MNRRGDRLEDWQVPLWDAINRYVVACGGDPSKRVYGNTSRQAAVGEICNVVRAAEKSAIEEGRELVRIVLTGDDVPCLSG